MGMAASTSALAEKGIINGPLLLARLDAGASGELHPFRLPLLSVNIREIPAGSSVHPATCGCKEGTSAFGRAESLPDRQPNHRKMHPKRSVATRHLSIQSVGSAEQLPEGGSIASGVTLLAVREAAALLDVSECWVRRHLGELPAVRVGRLIRLDLALLLRQFQGRRESGNRLKPERTISMGCRRYQQGSVVKRGKRGQQVWYGMWREDVSNPDRGFSRRQRCVRLGTVSEFPNRSVARERLSRLMGQKPSVQMKFSDLVCRWTAAVVPTLKDSTADQYLFKLRRYVVPAFGNREVSAISRYDVETFLAEKAKMYCRNTLRGMRASLSQVLSWAASHEWIDKNPCIGVKLPLGGSKVKRATLTPEQVIAIVNRLEEPFATLVLVLAVTGLRVGEAVGIKCSDFDGDILHVQRRIYERREGPTKNPQSRRSIPIPSVLLRRISTLGDGEWIFRSRAGTPVDPKNALSRYLRPVTRELGIALGGWHDFRHTLTTQLLKRYPTKVVSELLGHSNVKTTLETYQHIETEDFRAPLTETAAILLANVSKCPNGQQSAGTSLLN